RDAAEAGAAYVFRRNHVDRARSLPQRLTAARSRNDAQFSQLLDSALEKLFRGMRRQPREGAGSQARDETSSGRSSELMCRAALRILGESRGWQYQASAMTALEVSVGRAACFLYYGYCHRKRSKV